MNNNVNIKRKGVLSLNLKVGTVDKNEYNLENVDWKVCKNGDLMTYNFSSLQAAFFKYFVDRDLNIRYEITDINNNKYQIGTDYYIQTAVAEERGYGFIGQKKGIVLNNTLKVAVGTGSTAPQYTDYKLENQISEALAQVPQINQTSSNSFSIVAALPNTGGQTLSEAGLFMNVYVWDTTNNETKETTIMLARDTFNSFTVPSTQIAVVQYSFVFE